MDRLLIIPAAGLGSRLSSSIPKVMCPVNGKPMIDHLLDLYGSFVDCFILVLHPSFAEDVRLHCTHRSLPIEYALQRSPTGMLDAILTPWERVRDYQPNSVWITWCDQVGVHSATVRALAELSTQDSVAAMVFPTVTRQKPYIHLIRNDRQEIVQILHQREGHSLPQVGESDMGLFCLRRDAYLKLLLEFSCDTKTGSVTGERNFLPFIPWLYRRTLVRTFPGCDEIEALGVNTMADLRQVEGYLQGRE